jgi:rhodanese-related sulfurtransferase
MNPWRLKAEAVLTGENLGLFAALLVMTTLLHKLYVRGKGAGSSVRPIWVSVPVLLLTCAALAIVWHFLSEDGYARNPVAVRTVIQQHRPSFLPKLAVSELEKALGDKDVVIVDARYPLDYQSGHLPGAINVPVFTTQAERRKLLGHVPRQARVIVYCQSEGCQFDEALGSALVAEGIENVSLFPGGWTKWEEKGPKVEKKDKEKSSNE